MTLDILPQDSDSASSAEDLEADDASLMEDTGSDGSPGTDDELAQVRQRKSKKAQKRKLRATSPSRFGNALQSLLSTDAPSNQPLSLKPSVGRKRNDEKLELRAKKAIELVRKDQEEKGRVKDVIGGWGGESERSLRKVAQRGVVKLFNVIQHAQNAASADANVAKASRGKGKPSLPAPQVKDRRNKSSPNAATLDKIDFLDAIRSGGIVSKA